MNRCDLHRQPLIALRPRGRRPLLPGIEARPGDPEHLAQRGYGEAGLLRRDEAELHSLSLAKKAVAFFRMSRSIRRRLFSRRSCASSSRSLVVSAPAGPRPASISACRTHRRSAVSVRSSSRAIAPILFPLSRTNRTVSALNSSENARRLRFFPIGHSYRTFVRFEVSTKPGEGQPAAHNVRRDPPVSCAPEARHAASAPSLYASIVDNDEDRFSLVLYDGPPVDVEIVYGKPVYDTLADSTTVL